MPRPPRIHFPGAVYHVVARGNGGQRIFDSQADPEHFLSILSQTQRLNDFRLYAYCLMGNHFHLLLRVGSTPLSFIMHRLQTTWALRFNLAHSRVGHLFQGRYHAGLCQDDIYLKQIIRYIHMNPVKDGLVERPEQWKWSGHSEYLGNSGRGLLDRDWGLSLFSGDRTRAIAAYEHFLLKTDGHHIPNSPEEGIPAEPSPVPKPHASMELLVRRSLEGTAMELSDLTGPSRARQICAARRNLIHAAYVAGYSLVEVAAFLGVSTSAASRSLAKSQNKSISQRLTPIL